MKKKCLKYREKLNEKYLPKVQYAIEVLNSCKTDEQVNVCVNWVKTLLKQWEKKESANAHRACGTLSSFSMIFLIGDYMDYLHKMFALVIDRKNEEMSKNYEI